MELHAFDRALLVAKAHDLAFRGPRGDLEAIGKRLALDDERVIARGFERRGETGEDALSFMEDRRDATVHQTIGTHDLAAERLADRLMTEADAEDRHLRMNDGFERDTGF